MSHHQVIVVGAGPVGLLLGAELALGGAQVVVLDQLTEPSTTIKAGSINQASAELLGRRGLLDELRAAADRTVDRLAADRPADRERIGRLTTRAGHYAGIWLPADLVDEDDPRLTGHHEALGATLVPQQEIETILAGHAERLGVEVRRGVAVSGVDQHDEVVTLTTDRGPLDAEWVVGCDGGRSVVRHATSVDFPGTDPEITGRQAVVDLEDDSGLPRGWSWSTHGVFCYGPTPGRVLTVEFDGPPADRDAPVTAAEVQESLRRTSGVPVVVRSLRGQATRWTDNARQASAYRDGRVLLAGDAAHVHSPFSGQGLNLGLGDAMNLGWKLARVVSGRSDPTLLDTYGEERHPVGAWVLDWTRGQVALMRPDPKNGPLRDLVTALVNTHDGASHLAALISGLGTRLPLDGVHPLVGRTVPDVALADGTLLREAFPAGRFVLAHPAGRRDTSLAEVGHLVDPDDLEVVVTAAGGDTVLARPDGVVVLATSGPAGAGSCGDRTYVSTYRAPAVQGHQLKG